MFKFDPQKPKEILNLIRGMGTAELRTDDDGDPVILADISGFKYRVHFYNYSAGKSESIQFIAAFSGRDNNVTLENVNDWNLRYRFSKCYIDQGGDIVLSYDTYISEDGSKEYLEEIFKSWTFAVFTFLKRMSEE